jgi:outer membrane protein assembly factor BamD
MKRIILISFISLFSLYLAGCQTLDVSKSDPSLPYQKFNSKELLAKAERAAAQGKFSQAGKYIDAMEALYPYSKERENRIVDAVYINYASGKEELALAECDLYHLQYPQGKNADYIYYMQGVMAFDKSSTSLQRMFKLDPALVNDNHYREAYHAFTTLVNQYPNSRFAADANLRLHYIRNILARHQLIIANYYYQRGAYVASANRAREIVMHFNGTPAMTRALEIMQSSYLHLGMPSQAKEVQSILDGPGAGNRQP